MGAARYAWQEGLAKMDKNSGFKTVRRMALVSVVAGGLAACDENGQFALPTAQAAAEAAEPLPANAPNQRVSAERDIERPDIFEQSDRALWDGRPSLGGVWVAHPDVGDPERVLIRNTANGETIVGALFRRERLNPGPPFQISSDAADALGVLPGAPVEVYVVALRREEVEVVVPAEENPVVASLEAPVNVEAAPLDPAPVAEGEAGATAALAATATAVAESTTSAAETSAAAASLAAIATSAAAATTEAATDAAPEAETVDVSAVFAAPLAPADGPRAQIGIFSNERNANAAAARIQEAGLAAEVLTETMGGQTVWRVVAGPLPGEAAIATLKELGYVDAFILEPTE